MREQDYKPKPSGQNDFEDDLDRAVNSALALLATVEARAGLEDRVLASLRAEESIEHRTWWAWGFATAILLVLIVGVALHSSRRTRSPIANEVVTPAEVKPVKSESVQSPVIRSASPVRRTKLPKHQALAANPKLDQFPSPRPLSEQEKILAMYISEDPEHAALIAEARMDTLRQDEAEKMRLASEDVRAIGR